MVMPHRGIPYHCHLHGRQLAKGCVIECPVCKHIDFLKFYYPEDVAEFEANWRGSDYDQPATGMEFFE